MRDYNLNSKYFVFLWKSKFSSDVQTQAAMKELKKQGQKLAQLKQEVSDQREKKQTTV